MNEVWSRIKVHLRKLKLWCGNKMVLDEYSGLFSGIIPAGETLGSFSRKGQKFPSHEAALASFQRDSELQAEGYPVLTVSGVTAAVRMGSAEPPGDIFSTELLSDILSVFPCLPRTDRRRPTGQKPRRNGLFSASARRGRNFNFRPR